MHIPLVLLIIEISAALASLCSSQPVKKNGLYYVPIKGVHRCRALKTNKVVKHRMQRGKGVVLELVYIYFTTINE